MDRLIAELEEKARRRADQILEEAREEAESIRATADREVERIERVRLSECAAEWRERAARRTAEVRSEAAKVTLLARARFLDRVFERARGRIGAGEFPAGYDDTLGDWIDRAFDYLGEEPARVVCAPDFEPIVAARLSERSADLEVDDRVPAGFVARADDGSLEIDGTLAGALDRMRDELAIEALDRFEGGRT